MINDRIIFVGRNTKYDITCNCFRFLAKSLSCSPHQIVAVVVSNDQGPSSLSDIARSFNLPVLTPNNNDINDPGFVRILKNYNPTIMLTVQFPAIYRKDLIGVPSRACLNVHRGWPLRGGSIDQRSIVNKLEKYNIILHHIDEGIDTGPIIGKITFDTDPGRENGFTLDRKVSKAGLELIEKEFICLLGNPVKKGTSQDGLITDYENKWSEAEKIINPGVMNFEEAEKQVRALHHPREKGALLKMNHGEYRISKIVRYNEKKMPDKSLNTHYVKVKFKDCESLCFINKGD